MAEQTRAQALWQTEAQVLVLEEELETLLDAQGIAWSDYTTDAYDLSLEIYGMKDEWLTPAQVEALKQFGFSQIWTHTAHRTGLGRLRPGNIEYHYGGFDKGSRRTI